MPNVFTRIDLYINTGRTDIFYRISGWRRNDSFHISKSYGIYVAKLAGIKKSVITRAKEILKYLENVDLAKKTIDEKKKKITTEEVQVDMFNYKMAGVVSTLEKIDLDELTPKDALEVLYKLKEKLD